MSYARIWTIHEEYLWSLVMFGAVYFRYYASFNILRVGLENFDSRPKMFWGTSTPTWGAISTRPQKQRLLARLVVRACDLRLSDRVSSIPGLVR